MVDYIKALLFPFLSRENVKNFVIAGIINIFWFLVVPIFFVWGYLMKLVQHVLQEKDELPGWGKPLEILKHGVSAVFIIIVYNIIPFLIGFFVARSGLGAVMITTPEQFAAIPSYFFWLSILSGILAAIIWFILPMALINYAATEDIRRAFNFPEIFGRLRKRLFGYLTTYAIAIGITIPFILILLIPFVQLLAGFFLFYVLIFVVHTFSQIYAEAENL